MKYGGKDQKATSNIAQASVSCTGGFVYTASMLPDTYEVTVQSFGKDTNIGAGTYSVLSSLAVTTGQSNLTLDLRPVTVSGVVKLNGATPVASGTCSEPALNVFFRAKNTSNIAQASVGCTGGFVYTASMLPDTYEVTVQSFGKDTNIGAGTYSVLPSLAVSAGQSNLALDLRPVTVSGAVRLNGAPPVASGTCSEPALNVFFRGKTTSNIAQAGVSCTGGFVYTASMLPDTYEVTVQSFGKDTNIGAGTYSIAPALRVP